MKNKLWRKKKRIQHKVQRGEAVVTCFKPYLQNLCRIEANSCRRCVLLSSWFILWLVPIHHGPVQQLVRLLRILTSPTYHLSFGCSIPSIPWHGRDDDIDDHVAELYHRIRIRASFHESMISVSNHNTHAENDADDDPSSFSRDSVVVVVGWWWWRW